MKTQHFENEAMGKPGSRLVVSNVPITVCGVSGQQHSDGFWYVDVSHMSGLLDAIYEEQDAELALVHSPTTPSTSSTT